MQVTKLERFGQHVRGSKRAPGKGLGRSNALALAIGGSKLRDHRAKILVELAVILVLWYVFLETELLYGARCHVTACFTGERR